MRPDRRWRELTAARNAAGLDPDLSGAKSHQLDRLIVACQLESEFESDERIKRAFGQTFKWRLSLRYRPMPYGKADLYKRARHVDGLGLSDCLRLAQRGDMVSELI